MRYTREDLKQIFWEHIRDLIPSWPEYRTVTVIEIDPWELYEWDDDGGLFHQFIENPDVVLKVLSDFLYEETGGELKAPVVLVGDYPEHLERVIFSRDPSKIKLSEEDVDTLIVFTGQLVSTLKEKKSRYTKIDWVCSSCGGITRVEQDPYSEKVVKPFKCSICGNTNVKFKIRGGVREDILYFTLQDISDENFSQMRCMVRDSRRINRWNLTIGEVYRVIGILRFKPDSERKTTGSYYLEVLAIEPVGQQQIELSAEDEEEINKLAGNPGLVEFLKAHIAPDIIGWDDLKEILLIQLVGGVDTYTRNGTHQTGSIHVLLIGDPGTAKTELMRAMKNLAPKAIDAMGTAATNAGLTVAAVKDPYTHDWAYIAGVFPLANGGLAIVDELDKLLKKEKDYAFLEALENQEVTKQTAAGRVRFKTTFSFLGGANPKEGKWSDDYELAEQVDLTPQLFSRMDFIYVLRDRPDEEMDEAVARAIITQSTEPVEMDYEFFKKYIAYARNLRPRMTQEATRILVDYYKQLRKRDGVYITHRQIRTLRKVAAAYAKLRLHEEVTAEDASAAVNLYDRYLRSWNYDIAAVSEGYSMKELSIRKEIMITLSRSGGSLPYEEVLAEVTFSTGYPEEDVQAVIEKMIAKHVIRKKWPEIQINTAFSGAEVLP